MQSFAPQSFVTPQSWLMTWAKEPRLPSFPLTNSGTTPLLICIQHVTAGCSSSAAYFSSLVYTPFAVAGDGGAFLGEPRCPDAVSHAGLSGSLEGDSVLVEASDFRRSGQHAGFCEGLVLGVPGAENRGLGVRQRRPSPSKVQKITARAPSVIRRPSVRHASGATALVRPSSVRPSRQKCRQTASTSVSPSVRHARNAA